MREVVGAVGMEEERAGLGPRAASVPVRRATVTLEGARGGPREVAALEFAADGRRTGYKLNHAAVGAVSLAWLQDHEAAGWPDARLDRDQQLGAFVARLCRMVTDAASAAHYAANPVQLPWHGDGVLVVRLVA